MNLVNGKIVSSDACDAVLGTLNTRIQKTLAKPTLDPAIVIAACDALSVSLDEKQYEQTLIEYGVSAQFVKEYIREAKIMLSKAYLCSKMQTELGAHYGTPQQYKPSFYDGTVIQQIAPLGVLFHIAAGNADGLPVFTVIEGLLTGNINILKLPREEGGLTVQILLELFRIQPQLAEYVYIFDYASNDMDVMRQLADLADAVVVWGGDAAIQSVREMAKPNTKIIEWGHKISFAYVSGEDISEEALEGIAQNICQTNQLLCSSCQGIYIDTEHMDDVDRFCNRFLPILERTCGLFPAELGIGMEAQVGLRLYNASIETVFNDTKLWKGQNCSLFVCTDMALQTSVMFRNCWVKRLPRSEIIGTLRPYKNYLQTIGLVCEQSEMNALSERFWKTGAVRITDGAHMSKMYNGSAHDGEFPLRRYTKTVALERFE
ncbi:MAG: acyl-CoA reductase [Oscillospiraceae bacterium]|nr:acyl-CoA reductase [Oscillospiraceae bacterium]